MRFQDLSDISITQPHAAYSAFLYVNKWNYFIRCIPEFLLPLEEIICGKFLPNLTGQSSFNDVERDLLSPPPRLGGWAPSIQLNTSHSNSISITALLVKLILQ